MALSKMAVSQCDCGHHGDIRIFDRFHPGSLFICQTSVAGAGFSLYLLSDIYEWVKLIEGHYEIDFEEIDSSFENFPKHFESFKGGLEYHVYRQGYISSSASCFFEFNISDFKMA